jgi:hypothetical protein
MLFFAMMSIMFTKHSRFADLRRKLEAINKKSKLITVFVLLLSFNGLHKHIIMSMMPLEVMRDHVENGNHTQ